MFCCNITEKIPRQVPHVPQCSYGPVKLSREITQKIEK